MGFPLPLDVLAVLLVASLLLCSSGADAQCAPGTPGCPFPPNNNPICGKDASAAQVTYSTTDATRTISTNGCPPYDWTDQSTPGLARQNPSTFNVARRPIIQANIEDAVPLGRVKGPVGQTLFGPPLFSPFDIEGRDALVFEGTTFDHCGGHVAPGPDQYHYHSTPGDVNPTGHSDSRNGDFKFCSELNFWNQPTMPWRPWTAHSPLFGVMADGVPIFGFQGDGGQVPSNLDACQGHTDISHPYYHYHTTSNFPYLTTCLRGCMDTSIPRGRNWNGVSFPACNPGPNQHQYYLLDFEIPAMLTAVKYYKVPAGNRRLKM